MIDHSDTCAIQGHGRSPLTQQRVNTSHMRLQSNQGARNNDYRVCVTMKRKI